MKQLHTDIAIIGAGLTGLTTAFWLTRAGKKIQIIERQDREADKSVLSKKTDSCTKVVPIPVWYPIPK